MPNYKKAHPPFWLERSKSFRKLYALRRVLHYSAPADFSDTDGFIRRAISDGLLDPDEGFFVDVGCFHPCKENTTYGLYRGGWRGINIDLDEVKIEAFNLKRPGDINIACGVSDRKGTAEYWKQGFWSTGNSFENLEKAQQEGWKKTTTMVDTLTNLIDDTPFRNRPIDFLSVDVESHELSVLQSLDFDRYQPKIICVETWDRTLADVLASALYDFLTSRRYILINWVQLNLIFGRKDCFD